MPAHGRQGSGLDGRSKACGGIRSGDVPQLKVSNKDKSGTVAKPTNCTRLWDPDWHSFGTSRHRNSVPDNARMGLVLSQEIKTYEELVYVYDWAKHEGGLSSNDILDRLSRSGGNK